MRRKVIIQFIVEGFHNYPDPPSEVKYLRNTHRHQFTIQVRYTVNHNNREKEIFIQREYLKEYLTENYGNPCHFNSMSCEDIASELLQFGKEDGMISCEVWEENTGGALVEL